MSLFNKDARENQLGASLADMAQPVKSLADLIRNINLNQPTTINIPIIVPVTSNTTVPKNIRLKFSHGGQLQIKSGITLTMNGIIDAGDYQIFSFDDTTSILTTSPTKTGTVQQSLNNNRIKLAWFGAKGDATFNYNTQTITGTDDSTAIKMAMDFAGKSSVIYPNFGSINVVTIEASPNSMYIVQGDNILGCQDSSLSGVRFKFKGNGSTFYHKPLTNTDALMNNMKLVYRPHYKDFSVYVYGFTGRLGRFFDTNGDNTFNSGLQGIFDNIVVGDWTQTSGYDIIFNTTGTNMIDNYKVMNSQLIKANVIYRNVNQQAVNWRFENCYLAPATTNGIGFYLTNPSSANFHLDLCEIMLQQDYETLIKTDGSTGEQRPVFHINGRIEIRSPKHTLIDADTGIFEVNGFDMTYGASTTTTDSYGAKLTKNALVRFINSTISENFIIDCTTAYNYAYKDSLFFDNCSFFSSDGSLKAYPSMQFKDPNGNIITRDSMFTSDFTHRDITVQNPRYSQSGGANLPIKYSFRNRQPFEFELFNKYAGGKVTLPFNSYHWLPYYSLIHSFKFNLNGLNTTNVDAVKIQVLGSTGGLLYSKTVDLTTYVSGNEILSNQYICIQKQNQLSMLFYKGATQVTDLTLMPNAWATIKYKAMASALEYNTGTVGLITI